MKVLKIKYPFPKNFKPYTNKNFDLEIDTKTKTMKLKTSSYDEECLYLKSLKREMDVFEKRQDELMMVGQVEYLETRPKKRIKVKK